MTVRKRNIWWFLKRLKMEYYAPTRPYTMYTLDTMIKFQKTVKNLFSNKWQAPSSSDRPLVFYDLRCCPITFDFAHFLYQADIFSQKHGFDQFDLVIVEGDQEHLEEYDKIIDREQRSLRVANMLFPMGRMYSACNSIKLINTEREAVNLYQKANLVFPECYTGSHLRGGNIDTFYREAKRNTPYSGFKAHVAATRIVQRFLDQNAIRTPIVSLTIRYYDHEPLRNSDLNAYFQFAEFLKQKGYTPIFVPDADNPYGVDLESYASYEPACWNLFLRMALYELCFTNIFSSGGTHVMAQLNQECSYLIAGVVNENYPEYIGVKKYLTHGIEYGDQFLCGEDSRIEYGEASYENFVKNFEIIEKVKN